jgi:curli biogenesis system outer membrane secretion channel CsgG
MKTIVSFTVVIILLNIFIPLRSQVETNKQELKRVAKKEHLKWQTREKQAVEYATEYNIPVKLTIGDKVMELIFINKSGKPQYLITGAIVYYHVDLISGGGGLNIDAIGAHFKTAVAKVAIELRLVSMSTSEIVWSTIVENRVEGISMGADIFRFITSFGHEYLVQAEAGMAAQLPANYALHIGMEEGIASMIIQNKKIFLRNAGNDKKG